MTHNTTRTDIVLSSRALYIAMDFGRDSWQLAISDGGKTIREVKVVRKDVEAAKAEFLTEVAKARVKFGLEPFAPVHALYEAGRDGFLIAGGWKASGFRASSSIRAAWSSTARPTRSPGSAGSKPCAVHSSWTCCIASVAEGAR